MYEYCARQAPAIADMVSLCAGQDTCALAMGNGVQPGEISLSHEDVTGRDAFLLFENPARAIVHECNATTNPPSLLLLTQPPRITRDCL